MALLAIKGHKTRGGEVINILSMLGGYNKYDYVADYEKMCFYVGDGLKYIYYNSIDYFENKDVIIPTLEEFLEKFPYKVGDKVTHNMGILMNVVRMYWDFECDVVRYDIQSPIDNNYKLKSMLAEHLQPYKEEIMEEKDEKSANHVFDTEIISFDIAQRDKYELDLQGKFHVVLREGKYYVERIKPRCPKTYEECCKVLGADASRIIVLSNRKDIIHEENKHCYEMYNLYQLLICRDAYWKIAGDWKFDFDKSCYYLCNEYGSVQKFSGRIDCNAILTFPTEEMRDVFYDNFKELIESCKEFL